MLPFYSGKIRFATHNLLTLRGLAAKKLQPSSNHLTRKARDEKRKAVCYGREGWGKGGDANGCRAVGPAVGPAVDTQQTPGPALLLTVLLAWDCATQSPVLPLFREAIGGPVTAKAETTAILSTLCPPARKVCDFAAGAEYQQ